MSSTEYPKNFIEKIRDIPGLADLDTDWKVGRFDR